MSDGNGLDELEYKNLQGAVASIETLISLATPDAKRVYEQALGNAHARLEFLEKTIAEHKAEVEQHQREQTAAAAMAAKETKLSSGERETYRGFLEESYFTKKDFGKLDEFYTHSYDRLSEGGKDEMSKRLHEGIKRGEFKFSDLSEAVQERDNSHCSTKPAKENPAQAPQNQHKDHASRLAPPPEVKSVDEIDLGSVDLTGVKLASAQGSQAVSSLPDISGSQVKAR